MDRNKLFDTVRSLNGDYSAIAERLFCVFLGGEASWREALGMAFYGIELVTVTRSESLFEEARSADDETAENSEDA